MPEADRPDPVELDEQERELVAAEIDAILPALADERAERLAVLREQVDAGHVDPDRADALAGVVELALQTGRARQRYTAEGERVLTALLRRTPRGRELTSQLAEVNRALEALTDSRLTGLRVGMRTVGHFTVTISTEGARLTLAVRPDGVSVDSIAVGEPG